MYWLMCLWKIRVTILSGVWLLYVVVYGVTVLGVLLFVIVRWRCRLDRRLFYRLVVRS